MTKRVITTVAFASVPLIAYAAVVFGMSSTLLLTVMCSLAVAALTWSWPGWTK